MSLKFSKSTNTEHKEKLDSKLVFCAWTDGSAFAGQKAHFEIGTCFVGQGVPVKVTGKSKKGKKLGKVSGKVKANGFRGAFDIPEDIETGDRISFKVDLSKNGLDGESEFISVFPKVDVRNMKWSADEVHRGDVLTLKAAAYGALDGTPAKILIKEFDKDGIHDRVAEIPTIINHEKIELRWEFQYHDSTLDIPDNAELSRYGRSYKAPQYFFIVKVGSKEFGKAQESGLITFKDEIELFLRGQDGGPIGGEKFKLHFADGSDKEDKLGDDGRAVVKDVPPGPVTIEFPEYPHVRRVDDDDAEAEAENENENENEDADSDVDQTQGGLRRQEQVASGGRYVFEPVPFRFSE